VWFVSVCVFVCVHTSGMGLVKMCVRVVAFGKCVVLCVWVVCVLCLSDVFLCVCGVCVYVLCMCRLCVVRVSCVDLVCM